VAALLGVDQSLASKLAAAAIEVGLIVREATGPTGVAHCSV
jgi:hypothetical protein